MSKNSSLNAAKAGKNDEFEILGMANTGTDPQYDFFKPGKLIFKRLLIKRK